MSKWRSGPTEDETLSALEVSEHQEEEKVDKETWLVEFANAAEAELSRVKKTVVAGQLWVGKEAAKLWQLPSTRRLDPIACRNFQTAQIAIVRNAYLSTRHALYCVPAFVARRRSLKQPVSKGVLEGLTNAVQFLAFGWIFSPLLQLTLGSVNALCGGVNMFTHRYTYDGMRGIYIRTNCTKFSEKYNDTVYNIDRMWNIAGDAKPELSWWWKRAYDYLGSYLPRNSAPPAKDEEETHYKVLGLQAKATNEEVKKAYKDMAKKYHPDVCKTEGAHARFQRINRAYKTLVNPTARRNYDRSIADCRYLLATVELQNGLSGSVAEVLQMLFGGKPFEELFIGTIYRTRYHVRMHEVKYFNALEFEALLSQQITRLTPILANILDLVEERPVANGKDPVTGVAAQVGKGETVFVLTEPLLKLISHLTKCCFGREVLNEVGQCYKTVADTKLGGITKLGSPHFKHFRRTLNGMMETKRTYMTIDDEDPTARTALDVEWHDFHSYVFIVCSATSYGCVNDAALTRAERIRRAKALKTLSEKMLQEGLPWHRPGRTRMEIGTQIGRVAISDWNKKAPKGFSLGAKDNDRTSDGATAPRTTAAAGAAPSASASIKGAKSGKRQTRASL